MNKLQDHIATYGAPPAGVAEFVGSQIHSLVEASLGVGVNVRTLSRLMGDALRAHLPFPVAQGHATAAEGLGILLEAEGGCVDVGEARLLFRKPRGVTRQALAAQIRAGKVLAWRSGGGDYLVPVWQFRPEGGVIQGLPETLAAITRQWGDPGPLTAFAFLLQAHPLVPGTTPLNALRAGRLEEVLAAVEADAR